VRVWDISTGVQLSKLKGHTSYVMSVAFSNDGMLIVSGSFDQSVRVWDALTGAQLTDSVCKSGLVTGKRPEPDRTRTCQDLKLSGPVRTVTAVRSAVHHKSENLKTEQRPVLTGLNWSFKDFLDESSTNCGTIGERRI
jgi:hypothetical protein